MNAESKYCCVFTGYSLQSKYAPSNPVLINMNNNCYLWLFSLCFKRELAEAMLWAKNDIYPVA